MGLRNWLGKLTWFLSGDRYAGTPDWSAGSLKVVLILGVSLRCASYPASQGHRNGHCELGLKTLWLTRDPLTAANKVRCT